MRNINYTIMRIYYLPVYNSCYAIFSKLMLAAICNFIALLENTKKNPLRNKLWNLTYYFDLKKCMYVCIVIINSKIHKFLRNSYIYFS